MKVRALLLGALSVVASLGAVQVAYASGGATVTATSSGQPYATPAGQTLVVDFDNANKNGTTVTNLHPTSGTLAGQYQAPSGDSTTYAYVTPTNGSTTINFTTGISVLSLLWGSIDTYNTITFSNGGTITGSDVVASPSGSTDPNGTKLVTISFAAPITSATFSSTANSFEFDDIAVTAAPEPGTWGLMLGGVALVGFAMRANRRRHGGFAKAA